MTYNIGVTGTGSLIGQGIIKCIKRSDYENSFRLIGFDYFDNTVGSFWCESNYLLPDILQDNIKEEVWLKKLTQIIIKENLKILFIGVDFELTILSIHKEIIEKKTNCQIVVSSKEVIETGNDKYLTYKFLKKNNLFYPETWLPHEINFDKIIFPLILKPRVGARSIGVHKVNSKKEFDEKIKQIKNPIIQECIGNENTEYTCGVLVLNGEFKGSITLKRALKNGNTSYAELKIISQVDSYIKSIAEKLSPFGSCNLQLRIDKNGIPKLFEINPRHSGTTFIRSLFGYNEVVFILKYLLENKEIKLDKNEGKAIRYFEETLI